MESCIDSLDSEEDACIFFHNNIPETRLACENEGIAFDIIKCAMPKIVLRKRFQESSFETSINIKF